MLCKQVISPLALSLCLCGDKETMGREDKRSNKAEQGLFRLSQEHIIGRQE